MSNITMFSDIKDIEGDQIPSLAVDKLAAVF